MPDEEFEGLTREETAALNEDAEKANDPENVEEEVERVDPSLDPLPYIDPTSVSPADPDSDPGRAKAAAEEAEAAEEPEETPDES